MLDKIELLLNKVIEYVELGVDVRLAEIEALSAATAAHKANEAAARAAERANVEGTIYTRFRFETESGGAPEPAPEPYRPDLKKTQIVDPEGIKAVEKILELQKTAQPVVVSPNQFPVFDNATKVID